MNPISANGYCVHFNEAGYKALNLHLKNNRYSNIFIISDNNVGDLCERMFYPLLETGLQIEMIEMEAGERNKSIEACVQVWETLTEQGADRKTLILNVGGGVVTDLGGFVASTFKRGIDFIHVPTTLLAMVDASVGGKNGIDLGHLKNQIGVINVPQMVLIDTRFLESLPQNQMRSGLAEMMKHGLIRDKAYWELFLDLSKLDYSDFDQLIYRSVEIKNEIVTEDPKEDGIRKALNFGHTLGHAIESFFMSGPDQTPLLHGEAIAVGMILEAHISMQRGLLNKDEYAQIKYIITDVFEKVIFSQTDIAAIKELLIHDKKNEFGKIQFALLDGIGKVRISQIVENEEIDQAFDDYKT